MPTQTDYTNDAQGRAKLTLTVNATTTGANWSAAVADGSTNYGGWSTTGGSWSVTIGGQQVIGTSGRSYDFGSGQIASPYFPRSQSGSVTLSPGTYTASATFSGDGTTVGTANVSFSFTVTAPPPTSYTVTFDANGGSGSMSAQTASSATALTANTFTRTNYTFAGWNTLATGLGTSYSDQATYPFTSSTTLYAQWTYSGGGGPTTYSYSYDSAGGSNTPSGGTVNAGTSITLGSPGTRSGYTFTGWHSTATGQIYNAGVSYTVNGTTTFTAQWTQDGGGATYPPAWSDNSIAGFIAGKAYSDAVSATNMNYSGAYSVSAGLLPSGISLNTSTGAITGTVTSATDYSFTITATNSYGSVQQAFSGSITGGMRVYVDGQWVKRVAQVYDNGEWKPATVNVFSNNSWSPTL
jgi:uncharacterized repeat protein (TIGR02543 family)